MTPAHRSESSFPDFLSGKPDSPFKFAGVFATLIGSTGHRVRRRKDSKTVFVLEKTMSDDYTIIVDGETMTPAEYGYQWIQDCCLIAALQLRYTCQFRVLLC